MVNQQPAAAEATAAIVPTQFELSVEQLAAQVKKIQSVLANVMEEGQHFGTIPGTKKKTLYKAGSELLCMLFRYGPNYSHTIEVEPDGHRTYTVTCSLIHLPTAQKVGEGMGLCTTREKKYAFRGNTRKCPECGSPSIRRSRYEKSGDKGWYCGANQGGCGAEFHSGDRRIKEQNTEQVGNPELPDSFNTVLKMACKRALAAAVLTATAASDIFSQDLDERRDPAVRDQQDDSGWDGDDGAVKDPDPYLDRLSAATSLSELNEIVSEIRAARFSEQDSEDLRQRYGEKLRALKAQRTQGSTLDDVASRQQSRER